MFVFRFKHRSTIPSFSLSSFNSWCLFEAMLKNRCLLNIIMPCQKMIMTKLRYVSMVLHLFHMERHQKRLFLRPFAKVKICVYSFWSVCKWTDEIEVLGVATSRSLSKNSHILRNSIYPLRNLLFYRLSKRFFLA